MAPLSTQQAILEALAVPDTGLNHQAGISDQSLHHKDKYKPPTESAVIQATVISPQPKERQNCSHHQAEGPCQLYCMQAVNGAHPKAMRPFHRGRMQFQSKSHRLTRVLRRQQNAQQG